MRVVSRSWVYSGISAYLIWAIKKRELVAVVRESVINSFVSSWARLASLFIGNDVSSFKV